MSFNLKLSICIPTYNRANFLPSVLDSIIQQAPPGGEWEICISDNASTDHTPQVIAEYSARGVPLKYHRNLENRGFDRNLLKAVELAEGEYCWLMSSDDILLPGAIARVLGFLERHPGISGVSVKKLAFDYHLLAPLPIVGLANQQLQQPTVFNSFGPCYAKLGTYLGYFAAHIVKRSLWQLVVEEDGIDGFFNSYLHKYILGCVIKRAPYWGYLPEYGVGWRAGNDSFLSAGIKKRLLLDVVGHKEIADALFDNHQDPFYRQHLRDVMCLLRLDIAGFKMRNDNWKDFFIVFGEIFQRFGRTAYFWRNILPVLLCPKPLLKGVRYIYQKTLKRYQAKQLSAQTQSKGT